MDAAAVNEAMAAVAEARAVAAEQVDAELRAAVRVAPLAMGLRSPSSIDETLDEVPAVAALFDRVDLAAGEPALDRLDTALDAAQGAVATTLDEADAGSWQAEFLTAQGEILDALEAWTQASGDVHEVVIQHWELWQEVVADAAALDENRWRYRTPEEAAGTWEIEIGDELQSLTDASAEVGVAADARDEAATEVVAADRAAAEVFAQRPTEQPSAAP